MIRYAARHPCRALNLLRRLAWDCFFSRSALVCYYNPYVLPRLMYAAPVRGSYTIAHSNKLEAFRILLLTLFHYPRYTPPLQHNAKGSRLVHFTVLKDLSRDSHLVHRCLSGTTPNYLSSSVHSHMARSAQSLGGYPLPYRGPTGGILNHLA